MSDLVAARAWITAQLRQAGFRGRGSLWHLQGREVQWVVHIDRLPHGNRLGIDVGLDLQVQSTPRRPTDCPILLHLENLPIAREIPISMALDLDSNLTPDDRETHLTTVSRALGTYLAERETLSAIRESYRAGDFGSGFIGKDVRALLEAEGLP